MRGVVLVGMMAAALAAPAAHAEPKVTVASKVQSIAAAVRRLPALARFTAPRPLSPRGAQLVGKIFDQTGYLLHDTGPSPNPADREPWRDREVKRTAGVLLKLPAELRFLRRFDQQVLPGEPSRQQPYTITHDAMNEEYQRELSSAEQSARQQLEAQKRTPTPLKARLQLRVRLALLGSLRALNMSPAFGTAFPDRREVRIYNELFRGSSLPGLRGMVAYTIVHEIGHLYRVKNPAMTQAWSRQYAQVSQREYGPWCTYAAATEQEGFSVGLAVFAVAPQLLKQKAPQTYTFFVERFGKDAFKELRGGVSERLAIEATYRLSDWLAAQSK
jgi:hypothetical protein